MNDENYNKLFLDQLTSGNEAMVKNAARAVDDFTRLRVREEGILRQVLPFTTLAYSDLDKQVDTDKNVRVEEMEPESPGAMGIPYGGLPGSYQITQRRYRVVMARIATAQATKDTGQLYAYETDVRQIVSDNSIKDILAEEDGGWFSACNQLLGSAGATVSQTGSVQWEEIDGGVTRESLNDALSIMGKTPRRVQPATAVVNTQFARQIQKWGRDEIGGDLAQELLTRGFTSRDNFLNVRWLVTIKREIVGDSAMFMFAEPKFLGKAYALEDITMFVKAEAYLVRFFAYEQIGAACGNVGGIARADFTGISA